METSMTEQMLAGVCRRISESRRHSIHKLRQRQVEQPWAPAAGRQCFSHGHGDRRGDGKGGICFFGIVVVPGGGDDMRREWWKWKRKLLAGDERQQRASSASSGVVL